MTDNFKYHASGLDSPAQRVYPITPNDGADLAVIPRALRVLTGGDLAIRDGAGTDVVIPVLACEIIPIRVVRVLATGTTATVIGLD